MLQSPSGQNVPIICGDNTGQHSKQTYNVIYKYTKCVTYIILVYVDMGANSGDSATLAFGVSGDSTNRLWDIKVTQIPCASRSA